MTTPRTSIIVPAYNYARYLGEALASAVAQTDDDWECIVVDDGSTDGTRGVAEEWTRRERRIRCVYQSNRGLPAARNTGLRESRGRYVQFLDADDRLAPEKLAVQGAHLDAHPGVDIVIGPAAYFRSTAPDVVLYSLHGHLSRPYTPKIGGTDEVRQILEHYNVMVAAAPLVRRTIFDQAGLFNEQTRACEDWDLWLRCAIAGCRFEYLDHPSPLALIRTHEASMSRSGERMMLGLMDAARTHADRDHLPLVYQMAAGVTAVLEGGRLRGAGRILLAARQATVTLWRLRWFVYAVAAVLLPRRLFWWVVTRPMPERALELIRRLRMTRV